MKYYPEEQAFYGLARHGIVRVTIPEYLRAKDSRDRGWDLFDPDMWVELVGRRDGVSVVNAFPSSPGISIF